MVWPNNTQLEPVLVISKVSEDFNVCLFLWYIYCGCLGTRFNRHKANICIKFDLYWIGVAQVTRRSARLQSNTPANSSPCSVGGLCRCGGICSASAGQHSFALMTDWCATSAAEHAYRQLPFGASWTPPYRICLLWIHPTRRPHSSCQHLRLSWAYRPFISALVGFSM